MKELMKKKDESLRLMDDRKVTIEILIHKIQQMNSNFIKEKAKISHLNNINVNNLIKEIDELRSNLRNLLFENGKKVDVGLPLKHSRQGEGSVRKMLLDKLSHSQTPVINEKQIFARKSSQTSTRSHFVVVAS